MPKKRVRITWLDCAVLTALAGVVLWIGFRASEALQYRWNWQVIPQYLLRFDPEHEKWVPGMLMAGILTTLRLSIWATLMAMILGTVMAMLRVGKNRFLKMSAVSYVALIRNIPILVWIFISYYFIADAMLPYLGVDHLTKIDEGMLKRALEFMTGPTSTLPLFMAGVGALAVYEGAYITEIIRAGIEDVDQGQWEASSALGFNRLQQMRHIILPQAFRTVLPPLAGQVISTIKDSAIVSIISIPELTFQGMELMAATFLTFEIWITILVIYFLICFCCSLGISYLERKMHHRKDHG